MFRSHVRSLKDPAIALLVIFFVLFLHGVVPFVMIPTLGQAVWAMGFSESLANGSIFNLYAHDFGIPSPAPMAFGLAGAWPASLLIRVGLHASDAYAIIVASWLMLSMYSAYQIAKSFGATRLTALLSAAAWLSMPIIWGHAGYSMLSLGIALLSFYFLTTFRLLLIEPRKKQISVKDGLLGFTAAIISIFMDGYTFMMFAVGSGILFVYSFMVRPDIRSTLIRVSLPLQIASFILAYLLFSKFIGKSNFDAYSLDSFRGWGLDLSFIVVPTTGILWLPDLFGWSIKRSDSLYFGDGSVWKTTFALPVLVLGVAAWWYLRRKLKIATGILLLAFFAFYMALGPSLKINSFKPEALQISRPGQLSAPMPAEYAVIPTGNAWLSGYLPGFDVMRASYRWWALGIFGLWLLFAIKLSDLDHGKKVPWLLGLSVLIILNMPNLQSVWQNSTAHREMFHQIDSDLVVELEKYIYQNEVVAFIPWGNDFLANYIAPKAHFRTFNIGGDKNLASALTAWPSPMRRLGSAININNVGAVSQLLVNGNADAVVLPYVDMLWAPHHWPCGQLAEKASCIQKQKDAIAPVVEWLDEQPYLVVVHSKLFSVVRLRPEFADANNQAGLFSHYLRNVQYPIYMGQDMGDDASVLVDGWYALEPDHVWSSSMSRLRLPVPEECKSEQCEAILNISVFGANPQRPVSIFFEGSYMDREWKQNLTATSDKNLVVNIPIQSQYGIVEVSIKVPDAVSPQQLGLSMDSRVLGVDLRSIKLNKY